MDPRYKNEIAELVAQGLGWAVEQEVRNWKKQSKLGKLTGEEILQVTSRDVARAADGMPVMHSAPRKIIL